jgi:hypothetical protein
MITVTVYLDNSYKNNVDFQFPIGVTKEEIIKHLNNKLTKQGWHAYDIQNTLF